MTTLAQLTRQRRHQSQMLSQPPRPDLGRPARFAGAGYQGGDSYMDENTVLDDYSQDHTFVETKPLTMRRLSEPIQRSPWDTSPVSPGIQGGAQGVIAALQMQAAELAMSKEGEMESAELGANPEGEGEEREYQKMAIMSTLADDPELVISCLIDFLQQRR